MYIQLIDSIYSHETFNAGILKNVTEENVYKTESITFVPPTCCLYLEPKAIMNAPCVYHSKCKAFGFKPLDLACDNCESIVSLPDISILICMYKICNHCTIKTGTCSICKATRYKLPVRVL